MNQEQGILDNISTGIATLDSDLNITALNAAAEAMLETSEARGVGMHLDNLVQQPTNWRSMLQRVLESNSPHAQRSVSLRLPSGQDILVDVIITPLHDEDCPARLLVELLAVDRLHRISREESLLHAQETSRAVIRGLAHEIKNPLGGVRGAAQLLARELPDEELAEYTNIIIREADRLRDLVDRLLGPNQEPDLRQINIHEVLEHVCRLVAAEAGDSARIVRDYDPSLPELPGDRAQLVQAVLNIARNALQAGGDGEQCIIRLRTRSQRQFTIGTQRHRLVCRIDIIDNGPGIPPDMVQAIFAPMVTGRADGTGLGLSIAQSIVTRHGGSLECKSEPGKTRFTIYLPLETHYD